MQQRLFHILNYFYTTIKLNLQSKISDSQMKHLSSAGTGKQLYESLAVTVSKPFVYSVQLNRPKRLNALNETMWQYVQFLNNYYSV